MNKREMKTTSDSNKTTTPTKMVTRSSANSTMETRSSNKIPQNNSKKQTSSKSKTANKPTKKDPQNSKTQSKSKTTQSKSESKKSKEKKPAQNKKVNSNVKSKTTEQDSNEPIEFTQNPLQSKKEKSSNSLASIIPNNLKVYVSQEIWSSWSNIRRDSFKQIIKNPNSFFYRNRPPGEPQKYGPFTQAEEKIFVQRLKYFREELGIKDGLWGYFAVPLEGRVGYQCSNYYRKMIQDGKIRDDNYEVMPDGKLRYTFGGNKFSINSVPTDVIEKLQEEAFAFIKQCFDNAKGEGEIPQVLKPVNVKIEETPVDRSESGDDGIFLDFTQATTTPVTGNAKFDIFAVKNGKERSCFSRNENNSLIKKTSSMALRSSTSNSSILSRSSQRDRLTRSTVHSICPLIGSLDPITDDPIERPMMDPMGIIMDRNTWKKIFSKQIIPPFEIAAFSMDNLVEINNYNFDEYRFYISNFVC